jgi:hypothetical protein
MASTTYPENYTVVSPSATGEGTHTRWIYLTSTDSTPDLLNEVGSGSVSPTTSTSSYPETPLTPQEEEIAMRGWRALQLHKAASEEIQQHWSNCGEQTDDDDEMSTEQVIAIDYQGHPLPKGIKGLGPEGTWIITDRWRPRASTDDPASTKLLPSIHEEAGITKYATF